MKNNYWITVLDYEVKRVFQYKITKEVYDDPMLELLCRDFLSNRGHNVSNCEWMTHENPVVWQK
jgi:hypothetical protein